MVYATNSSMNCRVSENQSPTKNQSPRCNVPAPRRLFGLLVLACLWVLMAGGQSSWAASPDLMLLSDEELDQISGAGEIQLTKGDFDVFIGENQLGQFQLDIAPTAFQNAQGFFTTLQAVSSAVDLTVIVNIYLNTVN